MQASESAGLPADWRICFQVVAGLIAERSLSPISHGEWTMPAKKIQRRYVKKSVYSVIGPSKKVRNLTFVGRFKIGKTEHLIFKVQRRAKKTR